VLGAAVSYVAARRGASDSLEAQQMAILAAREQEEARHRAELAREERDHRRAAYAELGGLLQGVDDYLNYLVGPVVEMSSQPAAKWGGAVSSGAWGAFYAQILDAMPDCRRAAAVYGSPELRAAVGAIGMLVRALAPPAPFADGSGFYMHVLTIDHGGISTALDQVADGDGLRQGVLGNIQTVQPIVRFALPQIRYEQLPGSGSKPTVPVGVAVDLDER
jgi:hypothetical protein